MSVASERIISLSPKAKCEPFKKKVKASHKLLKSVTENKVPSALSTPLPLTHEGFWGFPLSLFVVKYSYG